MSDEAKKTETEDHGIRVRGSEILGKRGLLDREYRVKIYDFRRPDKFSREQVRTVQILHETFSRLACTALSAQLRQEWEVCVESVDQLTFGEFLDSVEAPTLLALVSMKPLRGLAALQVDRAVYAAWLDRLFGGTDAKVAPPGREISDAERGAIEHPLQGLLGCLRESWSPMIDLAPALSAMETYPLFCQIVPPSEMILLVTFEASAGGERLGRMNLVVPYLTIEPIMPKLTAQYWFSQVRAAGAERLSKEVAWRVEADAEVLARGEALSLAGLARLGPGSLLRLPGMDEGRCRLRVGGREVLALKSRGPARSGELQFDAMGESGGVAAALEAAPEAAGLADASMAAIERGLESMRSSLERGLEAIGARVRGIEGRQEAFADRIAYGQSDAEAAGPEARPFARAGQAPADALAAALGKEGAQLGALVLTQLDDALAARILDALPLDSQSEIVRRIGGMGRVLPEVLGCVDRWLNKELEALRTDRSSAGGVEKIVGILNLTARATEKNVVESLQQSSPELAEEVKRNMFVFEDISLLDDRSLRAVAERADRGDLLAAMKPVSEKLRERILSRFSEEEAKKLREEYARLGKVRLSESDAAGMRVVAVIRELETEGRIFIERGSE